jgi:uncharacterized protein YjbI with pentapeptide repeats
MPNAEHLAVLHEGVKSWNRWRKRNPDVAVNLSRSDLAAIDLRSADLRSAVLVEADLCGAKLSNVNLCRADLEGAKLTGADLSGAAVRNVNLRQARCDNTVLASANLTGSELRKASFRNADLRNASLSNTRFSRTNVAEAKFDNAKFYETMLLDVDLSTAHGLETCVHQGPSSIDHRTLLRSRELPPAFLRGCGIPEVLIRYIPTIVNERARLLSCFISYSTKDQDFADRLHADLQNAGVRCWFAPHDIRGGRKIHEQIDEAIRLYDRLLLILSEHSLSSEWVKTEIAHARQKELNEKRQVLFPISLVPFSTIREWKYFDADIGKDSAREVREYFIPDFSNWKDRVSYEHAFRRLARDLRAGENVTANADGRSSGCG